MSSTPVVSNVRPASVLGKQLVKYCVLAAILTSILRLVSGRADWTRAWCYVAVTFGFQLVAGLVLNRLNPELLAERSRMRQGTKSWDRFLAPAVVIGPMITWAVAAAEMRTHWPPPVPIEWSIAALALGGVGFLITLRAMLANRFFAVTVRIQEDRGHVVIDSGPYGHVRHPGYSGALLFTMATPIALGSWTALIPAALTGAVLVVRTALEDGTLQRELAGYQDYARRVRWRLAPGLW